MDLTALIETVRQAIALTQVDPRSLNDALDAQKSLMDAGIPVFNAFIRAYKAHERAPIEPSVKSQWTSFGKTACQCQRPEEEASQRNRQPP
jgi:chromosome partitioning protein